MGMHNNMFLLFWLGKIPEFYFLALAKDGKETRVETLTLFYTTFYDGYTKICVN